MIHRNFDRGLRKLLFRRRFSAISIGGYDNCEFGARTIAVSMTIRRIFNRRQRPPISRGKIIIFMYSINSICPPPSPPLRIVALGQLQFRRLLSAISIRGEDNCCFENDSAQFRSAATMQIRSEDNCGFDDYSAYFQSAETTTYFTW